jgi:hypothetical protein
MGIPRYDPGMAEWPFLAATLASLVFLSPARLPAVQAPTGNRPSGEAPKDERLRAELLALARDDQEDIRAVEESRPSDPGDAILLQRSRQIHERNDARIKQIVAELGWPGRTLVGADGAHAAWLLVQHADTDRLFQKRCLELMREAFETGEVAAQDLAYLTDRVRVAEGQPQMYGTQGLGLLTPEDEARVDANRLALGLEPLRVFREKRRRP